MDYVDLSHTLFDGMPGYQFALPDGSVEGFTVRISDVVDREKTADLYENKASFLLSKVVLHTAVGTYIDVPYHRFEDGNQITDFSLNDFIFDGVLIDLSERPDDSTIISELRSLQISGKAVLVYFNKGNQWGTDDYNIYPAISERIIDELIAQAVKLVGVDTINIDLSKNLHRPAHTNFLVNNILIIENLVNLEKLIGLNFKLFAIPLSVKGVANMPVRVFAEIH